MRSLRILRNLGFIFIFLFVNKYVLTALIIKRFINLKQQKSIPMLSKGKLTSILTWLVISLLLPFILVEEPLQQCCIVALKRYWIISLISLICNVRFTWKAILII